MAKKQQQAMSRSEKRRLTINGDSLVDIAPLTPNQERIFKSWDEGKHLFIYGSAGTGKTFCALYKALKDTLKDDPTYDQIYLVRSLVATREIGFLPGDLEDKTAMWQIPYKNMVKYMFEMESDEQFEMLYSGLRNQETVKFWSTSFLRGVTLDDSVIIIDEVQNLSGHELDSIITRVGEGSRIVFCGDGRQSDLRKTDERNGLATFMSILEQMKEDFDIIEMTTDDIVRSGLVRNYLVTKDAMNIDRF